MAGRIRCKPFLRCRLLSFCVTGVTMVGVIYIFLSRTVQEEKNESSPNSIFPALRFQPARGLSNISNLYKMATVGTPIVEEVYEYIPDGLEPSDVKRNVDYCNRPVHPLIGDEGDAPKGFKLKMAHVFIRHGDRTPIHTIPGLQPVSYGCKFTPDHAGEVPKFLAYPTVMRNFTGKQKSSSHFKNWALMPDKEECGLAELTAQGALQHLRTGQYFYEKYVEQANIFTPDIDIGSQVYTKSTAMSRTYQSAVAFLYGFLPTFNLTNLNIQALSNELFCDPSPRNLVKRCHCKNANDEKQKSVRFTSMYNKQRKQYTQLRESVADTFDIEIDKVPWLSALIDTFVPLICHFKAAPCSDSGKCVSGKTFHQMWRELDTAGAEMLKEPKQHFYKYSSIIMYPVMVEIAYRMRDMIEKRVIQKLVLYSGHDVTLAPLLAMLGLNDGKWSPYASRFVIELYEVSAESKNSRYYLKFLYNGRDLTEDVKFCRGKTFRGFCKFMLFYDYVFTVCLQQFGYSSYFDACSRMEPKM